MPPETALAAQRERGRLLQLLPAIYQDTAQSPQIGMRGLLELLAAIEAVLLEPEPGPSGVPSLGARISSIPGLFRPVGTGDSSAPDALHGTTPREFLGWLAQWIGMKPELSELLLEPAVDADPESASAAERAFRNAIARMVPLYGSRGTRRFLDEALRLFIPEVTEVVIDDRDLPGLQVGKSALGKDSWLVTYRPFHFSVRIRFDGASGPTEALKRRDRRLQRKAKTIIELSKPAHTTYDVQWAYSDARHGEIDG